MIQHLWSEAILPWAVRPGTRGVSNDLRHHDIINIAFGDRLGTLRRSSPDVTIEEAADNFFVDTSYPVSCKAWSTGIHRLSARSNVYSFQLRRELNVVEHFSLLGYNVHGMNLAGLDMSDIQNLTGNGQYLLQTAIVVCALALCVDVPGLWGNCNGHA